MRNKRKAIWRDVTFVLFMGRLSLEKPIKVYELPQIQAPLAGTSKADVCDVCVV